MHDNPGREALADLLENLADRLEPDSGNIISEALALSDCDAIRHAAGELRGLSTVQSPPALDYRAAIQIPGRKGKRLHIVLRPGVPVEAVAELIQGAAVTSATGKLKDAMPLAFSIPNGHNLLTPLLDWEARLATPRAQEVPLSQGACFGILRRAAAAGVQLPPELDAALKANISAEQLTTLVDATLAPPVQTLDPTDVVAGTPRLVRPAAALEAEVEVEIEHSDISLPASIQEAFDAGQAAFAAGVALDDCPFTGTHRAHWQGGWKDAQRDAQADAKDPAVVPSHLEDRPGYKRAQEEFPNEYGLGVQACIDTEGNMGTPAPAECDTVEKQHAFNLGFTDEMVKRGWWDFSGDYQSPFHIREREAAAVVVPSPAEIFAMIESEDDSENARGLELARALGRDKCGGEDSGLLDDNPFPENSVAWEVWREGYLDVRREAYGIQSEPEALPAGAKAFQEGREAHAAGVPRDKCPHVEDGLASRMKATRWAEGWDAAAREKEGSAEA